MINAKEFNSQEKLEKLLTEMGFYPQSAQNWQDYKNLPSCFLDKKENGFNYTHVVVYIAREAFYIDFLSDIQFEFLGWAVLRGDITEPELRQKIIETGSEQPRHALAETEWEIAEWQKKIQQQRMNNKGDG